MGIHDDQRCPGCGADMSGVGTRDSRLISVEYAHESPERYDGVSEWRCPDCDYREGRWTGRRLWGRQTEPRFGERIARDLRPGETVCHDGVVRTVRSVLASNESDGLWIVVGWCCYDVEDKTWWKCDDSDSGWLAPDEPVELVNSPARPPVTDRSLFATTI
jgi:hypothetical protein